MNPQPSEADQGYIFRSQNYKYGNMGLFKLDVFQYFQKTPEYITYANMYNNFWI